MHYLFPQSSNPLFLQGFKQLKQKSPYPHLGQITLLDLRSPFDIVKVQLGHYDENFLIQLRLKPF